MLARQSTAIAELSPLGDLRGIQAVLAQIRAVLVGLDGGLIAGEVVQFLLRVNDRREVGPPERGPGDVMDLSSRTATVAGLDTVD